MKVIINYKNGKTYEILDLMINTVNWVPKYNSKYKVVGWTTDMTGVYFVEGESPRAIFQEPIIGEVLFIEMVLKKHGKVTYHFNPHIPMSIIPDVMTAQQRAKANRNGIMQMVNNTLSRLKDWKNYGQ